MLVGQRKIHYRTRDHYPTRIRSRTMSYSRDRAINYEHKKLVSQGGNPDCANVIAKELVRGDQDKAKRKAGRKSAGRKLKMSFSQRNVDDTPVPNNDPRFL